MIARIGIAVVGVAFAAYGAWLLLAEDLADLVDAAVWLGAGVVLHDFVLVPLTLALGWLVSRLVPAGLRPRAAAGLVVLGTLTVLAIPVIGRFGERPDNPTILDRGYTAGWLLVVVVVLVVVGVSEVARRRRRPR
ncbi:hypothetical protein ISU10_01530 [Nocardioides agariphilus]|uniref:Uncharacterized protein n=1 Tax=Nocardioides agariphilus TaxID=433664 RepID=A0A930VFA6_9ACTN|nr:hypothetical protein [Nocardioides agariphilus]MBF4766444.1 hypothetical protein [Nocardioides agariphilus]